MLHARVHWRAAHRCLVPPGISSSSARRHATHVHSQQQRVAAARLRAVHTTASASPTNKQELGWQELHRAAQIAAWSGLCYLMPGELPAAIEQQHKGNMTLLASGRNEYTSWFVVDAVVPAATFCSTVQNRSSRSSGSSSSSSGNTSSSDGGDSDPAAAAATGGVCAQVPAGTRERFVFFRGVSWAAPEYSGAKMSQALGAIWPTQFPPGGSSSSSSSSGGGAAQEQAASPLVAHAGVAGIASDLFVQLRPYMQQADDVGMPLCFAGHSLGGSLAMLTLVLHRMYNRKRRPTPLPSCYTFGSPPVLAHQAGGGGQRVLEVLGLPQSCVHNHVLEMDPVPRALLSVDPTFELLSSWGAVKGLLWLREQLVGAGSPLSPGRFLFESVGQVHLIKYTPEAGSQVVPLDAAEIQQELSMLSPKLGPGSAAAPAAAPQPDQGGPEAAAGVLYTSLRAWLDHHHRSYAQELEAAALRSVRQQMAAQQRQQQAQQQQAQQQQAQQQVQQQQQAQQQPQMVPARGDASA